MSSLIITVKAEDTKAHLAQHFQQVASKPKQEAKALEVFMRSLACGAKRGEVSVHTSGTNPVAAAGTLTLVSAIATDAITIAGVTFTATSTPTTELHWEIDGASDTLDAASLAAAINAHSTIGKVVLASSSEGVVTLTCRVKGTIGNFVAFSSADATITASGTGYLAGGTGGVEDAGVTYSLGI